MFKFQLKALPILLLLAVGCTKQKAQILIQNVSQENANSIILLLANNKIDGEKQVEKDGSFSILVDSKDQIKGLQILANSGEPQSKHTSMGEVFKKEGLISSPVEEFARYTYALDQDLEGTLSQIDGILVVKVHVSLPMPTDNLWSTDAPKPGAAVFIKYRAGYRIDLLTNRIKLLVSKAVPGLSPDMVEVFPLQRKDN